MRRIRLFAWAALLAAAARASLAQDGANHVVIRDFEWKLRSSEHFDIYYYEDSRARVPEAAEILEKAFRRLTAELGILTEAPSWAPEKSKGSFRWERRPFFLYASPNDFAQSNIARVGEGVGGVTEPFKDRFMVYNDGSSQWLEEVITHEFVHILQFHVLISGFWKSGRILKSIVYPLWMMEGMAGHLTRGIESALEEITIRDAATSGGLLPLTRLEHFGHLKPHQVVLAYKQGAAAMEFLSGQFGSRKVGDMLRLFETRFETSQVLSELVGLDSFEFDRKVREHLETKYGRIAREQALREPEAYGGSLTRAREALPQFNSSPVFSPDLKRMYYVSTAGGFPAEVREMDLRSGRSRSLGISLLRVESLPMGHFANLSRVLDISPDGSRLAFAGTKNHRDFLFLYDLRKGRLRRFRMPLASLSQPRFSPDGRRIAFSGLRDSFSDLYLYDLESGSLERLTEDPEDDEMPAFSPDGSSLIYSAEVSGPGGVERRLTRLDLKDRRTTRLEDLGGEARDPVVSPDGRRVLFVLERGGFSEVAELELESGRAVKLTRSLGGCFTPAYAGDEIAFAALRRGSVHIYKGPRADFLSEPASLSPGTPEPSPPVLVSTAPVSLGPEGPTRFRYSTDLFIPAFFYSSPGGLFVTTYWQGSDLLGNHQNLAFVNFQSGQSFDYVARYNYGRFRPQLVAGVDGIGRRDFIDLDTGHVLRDSLHTQFAGLSYPLDRFHSLQAFVRSDSERIRDLTAGAREDREGRLASASLVRDTVRGRYLVATSGNRLALSFSQAAEVLGGSRRFASAGAEAHQFLPTGSQSALAFRAAALRSLGPDKPQLILGGLGGVRGYGRSTKQDFGDRLAVLNSEWRFPVLRDINYYMWYLFPDFYFKTVFGRIFTDLGYAWNSDGELSRARWRDLRHSVGLGLSIYTFILQEFPLVISMDYARRTTQDGGIFYVYLGQLF